VGSEEKVDCCKFLSSFLPVGLEEGGGDCLVGDIIYFRLQLLCAGNIDLTFLSGTAQTMKYLA
jgi:hypothetical protein